MNAVLPESHLGTQCGTMVQGPGYVAYRCTRPLGHSDVPPEDPEPHFAVEIGASVRAWQTWKERQDSPAQAVQQMTETEVIPGSRLGCPACGGEGTFVVDEIDSRVGVLGTCHNCLASTHFKSSVEEPEPNPEVQQPEEVLEPLAVRHHFEGRSDRDCIHCSLPDRHLVHRNVPKAESKVEICPFPECTEVGIHGHGTDRVYTSGPEHGPVNTPTKQREGDQVLPTGGGECVQDRVIADMEESKRVGRERYGSVLKTFNGRRSIQDVHEEVRDLFVYLTQIRMEAEAHREALVSVVLGQLTRTEQMPEWLQTHMLGREMTPLAEIAVDAIMGWVAGRALDFPDPEDAVSVVLDSIHTSAHADATNEEMARNILSNLSKMR